jgi:hypothetical protein
MTQSIGSMRFLGILDDLENLDSWMPGEESAGLPINR